MLLMPASLAAIKLQIPMGEILVRESEGSYKKYWTWKGSEGKAGEYGDLLIIQTRHFWQPSHEFNTCIINNIVMEMLFHIFTCIFSIYSYIVNPL